MAIPAVPQMQLGQVHRVLRLQGLFFCISFNHNRAAQLADEPWKFSPLTAELS